MLQAWAPLLFADQQLPEMRKMRDPILPATISESAKEKRKRIRPSMDFQSTASLPRLGDLATRVRVTYGLKSDTASPTFQQVPQHSPLQERAYQLLASYPVAGN
jgi:hypothetical protein